MIDRDSGFELCRRGGIKAIVLGTYIRAGDTFLTDIKVLDARTKSSLKSANSRGVGVESMLAVQIDELSRQIVRSMGIAGLNVEAVLKPIADVSTSSMEAYNYYLRGREEGSKNNNASALRFMQMSVEKDPNFAMAHLGLSGGYTGAGNSKAALEAMEKAKALANRATEKERLYIEMYCALRVERDNEKYFQILAQLRERYPEEKEFHLFMGLLYQGAGDLEKAEEEYRRTLELDPDYGAGYNQLGWVYALRKEYPKAVEFF